MSWTVGMRMKKRVAKRLRIEWSSQWKYTHFYDEEEEAEAKRQEWLRHPANRELDFKVIEVVEVTHTGGGEVLSVEHLSVSEEAHEKPDPYVLIDDKQQLPDKR